MARDEGTEDWDAWWPEAAIPLAVILFFVLVIVAAAWTGG